MMLKKDKQKVLGEVFDDARVKSFLDYEAPAGVSTDFHLLEKAYRGMNIDNFVTFLEFFKNAGHKLGATNPQGQTLADIASEHRHGREYVQALAAAGSDH
ncbi:PA4642 family protein [SAR92 clade bacterium H921]|nr:PA4642 family protein [SAR92 clade bacterium H921]